LAEYSGESDLTTSNGKLQLVVRSKKVLARIERFDVPVIMQDGRVRFINKGTLKVYDYLFDEAQEEALREARDLASRSGMVLEVTDLTRQSPFTRIGRFLLARDGPLWSSPNLVVGLAPVSTTMVAHDGCDCVSSPVSRL
jgi:hypothetical protein